MKRTSWSTGLSVTADVGVVAHTGSIMTRLLADRTGLTDELQKAIADIDVLRHQAGVLGPVASAPTVWRTLKSMTPGRRNKIAAARAQVRRHVWAQLPGGIPASKVAGTDLADVIVLDVDATIVIAHSEKENSTRACMSISGPPSPRRGPARCTRKPSCPGRPRRTRHQGSSTTPRHNDALMPWSSWGCPNVPPCCAWVRTLASRLSSPSSHPLCRLSETTR